MLVDPPNGAVAAMKLPELDRARAMRGKFGYVHLFVRSEAELIRRLKTAKAHLEMGGSMWVSWPKGDVLKLQDVIRHGYDSGLVESTTLSIDETWSAIKFTHPKAGKVYRNSYGKLPERDARN